MIKKNQVPRVYLASAGLAGRASRHELLSSDQHTTTKIGLDPAHLAISNEDTCKDPEISSEETGKAIGMQRVGKLTSCLTCANSIICADRSVR